MDYSLADAGRPGRRASWLMTRCAGSSRVSFWLWRTILMALHGSDVGRGARIEGPLVLPHPVNIVIGSGARVAEGTVIYHGVTIGQSHGRYPTIEPNVTIYPNASVLGDIVVRRGSRIGAHSVVMRDTHPGQTVAAQIT